MQSLSEIAKKLNPLPITADTEYNCCFWCNLAKVPETLVHGRDLQCGLPKFFMVRDALELWQCPYFKEMPEENRDIRIRNRIKVLHDRIVSDLALQNKQLLDEPQRHAAIKHEGLCKYEDWKARNGY